MSQLAGFGLGDIVRDLGGELVGDAARRVTRIAPIGAADADAITFLANPKLAAQLATTGAGCVILSDKLRDQLPDEVGERAAILTPDPYRYYAALTRWWVARSRPPAPAGVHPSAVVDPTAVLGEGASVGPLAVVEAGATIGARTVIGPQCHIGAHARVGDDCRLAAGVKFGERCRLGERGILHGGVVVGGDGFGFAPDAGRWEKIEQLGAVVIGDDVEIGANTCIDRGALGDTVIGDGVKLDNLIQVAHNVRIGDHTAIAACVGIAGSTTIGAHCTIAGAAGINGHIEIADGVHIGPMAGVMHSIKTPGLYSGLYPIDDNAAWMKSAAGLRQLPQLRERVRALEAAAKHQSRNQNQNKTEGS